MPYHDGEGGDGWNPYVRTHSLFGPDNAASLANEGRLPSLWQEIMRKKIARLREIFQFTPKMIEKIDKMSKGYGQDSAIRLLEKRLYESIDSHDGISEYGPSRSFRTHNNNNMIDARTSSCL